MKNYEIPMVETVRFDVEDVITTSVPGEVWGGGEDVRCV